MRKGLLIPVVAALAFAAAGCAKKAPDTCKARTGDGLCADLNTTANKS
jgi:hypothetical protein